MTDESSNRPSGHYSPYAVHNDMIFISGQLPFDTQRNMPDGIMGQTRQVLQNLLWVLTDAGSSISNVLQMRIYLSNIDDWDAVNIIYAEFFGAHKPARCVVPTGPLHYGALIEIEAVAHV